MDDRARVEELLGRAPRGRFDVVVRDAGGDPVVVRNAPLLDDGTPMPTRYWLVGAAETLAISRIESTGGVRLAEAEIDPALVADAHRRYALERDALIPADHVGPRPSGGVAGTRQGIKCLHAHYAWFLAGGDDAVGAWVQARLDNASESAPARASETPPMSAWFVEVDDTVTRIRTDGYALDAPVGAAALSNATLLGDPPRPEELTNAIGAMIDHLDDVVRERPDAIGADVRLCGVDVHAIAAVEVGHEAALPIELARDAVEDVFRTLATERSVDRRRNPGLPADRVGSVVGASCIVVAIMRRLHLDVITVVADGDRVSDPATAARS